MALTNAWDESTPLGTENASTSDDYLRKHRLDLGERLEDMLYGFNTSDNTGVENDFGVKLLKLYKQTADPTAVTDYGHFYVKLVSGVPELFYQDDTNTTKQLTTGGELNIAADSVTAAMLEDDLAFLTFPTTPEEAPDANYEVANKKYVDDHGVIQTVNNQSVVAGAYALGATAIPYDDTIPQITEGTEFMTLAITPTSATTKLKIDVVFCYGSEASDNYCVALFQDTTAGALACAPDTPGGTRINTVCFTHYMTSGTTSETTFRVRAGATGGNDVYFNGGSAAAKYGTNLASSITITELEA